MNRMTLNSISLNVPEYRLTFFFFFIYSYLGFFIRRQLKYRVIDSASRVIYSTNKDYAINYFFLRVSNSAIEKAPKLLSPKKSPIQTSFPRKFSVDTFNFECINISPLYKRQRNFDNFYQSCDRLWIARAHTHHTHDTRCKIRFPPNAL